MNRRAREAASWRARLGRWLTAGAASLALHALLLALLLFAGFGRLFAPPPKEARPVALRPIDSSTWQSNRRIAPNKTPLPPGKVVDVAPGNGEKPDEDSRFLAEKDNRVERETMSRHRAPGYKSPAAQPTAPTRPSAEAGRGAGERERRAEGGGEGNAPKQPPRDGPRKGAAEVPSAEPRDRLALDPQADGLRVAERDASDGAKGNSDRLRTQPGPQDGSEREGAEGKAGSGKVLTLAPSASVIDRITGGPANDLTPTDDLEEGDGTYLNTREFKHAGFFNRIKRDLSMTWDPVAVARAYDPSGEIYLYKDRITVVAVTLDGQGTLKEIRVQRGSGAEFLDREAVDAFKRVSQFPNPPQGMTDEHGEVRFSFGFYYEVGPGRPRLFRARN